MRKGGISLDGRGRLMLRVGCARCLGRGAVRLGLWRGGVAMQQMRRVRRFDTTIDCFFEV
jgi:hypothetical protein